MTTLPTVSNSTADIAKNIMSKNGKEVKANSKKIAEQRPISFELTPLMEAVRTNPFQTIDLAELSEAELAITRNLSSILDWIPPDILELIKQAPEFLNQLKDMDLSLEGFLTKLKTMLPSGMDIGSLLEDFDIKDIFDNIERVTGMLDSGTLQKMGVSFFKDLLAGVIGVDVDGVFNNLGALFDKFKGGGKNGQVEGITSVATEVVNPLITAGSKKLTPSSNTKSVPNKVDVGAVFALNYALLNYNLRGNGSVDKNTLAAIFVSQSVDKSALPKIINIVKERGVLAKVVTNVTALPKDIIKGVFDEVKVNGINKPSEIIKAVKQMAALSAIPKEEYVSISKTSKETINRLIELSPLKVNLLKTLKPDIDTASKRIALSKAVIGVVRPAVYGVNSLPTNKNLFVSTLADVLYSSTDGVGELALFNIVKYIKSGGDETSLVNDTIFRNRSDGVNGELAAEYVGVKHTVLDMIKGYYDSGATVTPMLINLTEDPTIKTLTIVTVIDALMDDSGNIEDAGTILISEILSVIFSDVVDVIVDNAEVLKDVNCLMSETLRNKLSDINDISIKLEGLSSVIPVTPTSLIVDAYDDMLLLNNAETMAKVNVLVDKYDLSTIDVTYLNDTLVKTMLNSAMYTVVKESNITSMLKLIATYPLAFSNASRKKYIREFLINFKIMPNFNNSDRFIAYLNLIYEDWDKVYGYPINELDGALILGSSFEAKQLLQESSDVYASIIQLV